MARIVTDPIDPAAAAARLRTPQSGGFVCFEGLVRNHNEGRAVEGLFYEAYTPLAETELARILAEASTQFDVDAVDAVHRVGMLKIGEMAVWVGVAAAHRDAAFDACRFVIDELKGRVPIWKQEQYTDGSREWVACHHCARHTHDHQQCQQSGTGSQL